jgi:hypothetical protein
MGVTLGGVLLSALGAGLTVAGLSDGGLGTCDITEGQRCSARPSGAALFGIGVALSAVGDVSMLAVGPALWINGARQRPEEAR